MTKIAGAALRRNRHISADTAERRALFTREPDSQQTSPASSTRAGTASIDAWVDWPAEDDDGLAIPDYLKRRAP